MTSTTCKATTERRGSPGYVAGVRERLGEIGAVEEEHGMPGIVQGRRRPRMERGKREDKARRDVCVQPCLR
jgi:hypothetical protein